MSKALLIAFEGIDGAGKTEASKWFAEALEKAGVNCTRTREPGGTPLAEAVRELTIWGIPNIEEDFPPMAEALLYNASRSIHLQNMILPFLAKGVTVVTDRFCDSTYGHQGGGRGLCVEKLRQLHDLAHDGFVPDITFLFDGSPSLFKERMDNRNALAQAEHIAAGRLPSVDRLERQPIEFQQRSRQVHLDQVARDPDRYVVIDAEQSEAAVQAQLMPHLMAIVNRIFARPVPA